MTFSGLFELRTPTDLLDKLRFDLHRIEENPLDARPAFDFFVTADHMLDWVYPNDAALHKTERAKEPLLALCHHLSSGAKHFRATLTRHKSVDKAEVHEGQFSDQFPHQFDTLPRLEVHLTGAAASSLGFSVISVPELAWKVRAYWEEQLHSK